MNTSVISLNRVLRDKWLILTLGLVVLIYSSLPAAVLFSDNFDSYTNGTADANYTAAYNGPSGTTIYLVAAGVGLNSSQSVQISGTTTDATLIRKDTPIDLTAGTVTNSIFFQRVSAQIAAPQIGLMSEMSGALNTVNSIGGRLNQFDQLDIRSSEGGVQSSAGTAVAVGVTLTNGNWYNLRTVITKTVTTNQLTVVLQLWNCDPNGAVGSLIAANTQTATNASVWSDTTLYAAVRLNNGSAGVSNLDNFSAIQVSVSPTITLTGTPGAVDTTYGTASASPTSFQISGGGLMGAPGSLIVTPPSGYEVSRTNNSAYSTNLTVPYSSGTLASTNVYVRLAATTAVGTYSGNITVAGGGATAQTIATFASTVSPAVMYPPPGYQLVWADEFNGTNLDTTKWGYENPGKWRDGYNTPNAVSVTNGLLNITTYTLNGTNFTCELNTYNKFTPKYGYVEASIDFSDSPGMWSAFWLYNYSVPTVSNPKTNGVEVDIIEHLAHNVSDVDVSNMGFSTLHWDGYGASHRSVTSGNYNSSFATGFHTCALLWTPDAYKIIMDGLVVWTTTNALAQDPVPPASPVSQIGEFLLLSSEVWSNNWAGTVPGGGFGSLATSTTKLKVDYVRYYQLIPDTNPPVVLNVTPTNGATLFANLPIQISATVTDNVAVAFAQLYLDETNQPPAVTNAPYAFSLTNVSLGAHTLKVVGQDTSGNRATNSVNFTVVQPPPTIALTGPLGVVNTIYGTASALPTSFQISGSYLTGAPGNLTVTPPTGFEVSRTNNSAYSTNLSLPYLGGTLASTNVYVRLTATATVVGSPYSGNITVSGGGANQTIPTTSSAVSTKAASVTAVAKSKTYGDVNPALTAVTNGAVNGDVINVTLATTATQFSSVGVSNITVTLGSNPNYSVLTTNSTLTINPASTTLALASDNNPALPGTNVTFTAMVNSGAGIPTGSVTFKDGISTLGTSSLNGTSQAAFSTSSLVPGNHTITAEYAGGGNFSGSSNSPALTQIINPPLPPLLLIVPTGGGLQLSWDAPGFNLQQAAECTGPWMNILPSAASPFVITPTNTAAFFRLHWSAP